MSFINFHRGCPFNSQQKSTRLIVSFIGLNNNFNLFLAEHHFKLFFQPFPMEKEKKERKQEQERKKNLKS